MIPFTALKSTNRQNLIEVLPLQKPFTVYIEPSSHCNFRCVQCFQSIKAENNFTRHRMNMPLERFKKIIGQLQDWPGDRLKVLKLSLYGEPLINSDFCEMLKIAREADIAERIETTTNASLLTRAIAEKLVEYHLDYARVSIYASEQERHKAITGASLDIRIIHENLRVLKEIKKASGSECPFVSCKMLDSYSEENERFGRMYQDVADEVFLDKPHSWIKIEGSDFLNKYYQEDISQVMTDIGQHSTGQIACPMPFTTLAVRSNGDISPCCVDFIGGTSLGNIDQCNLRDSWYGTSWYKFQKMQLENRKQENASCARCDFYLNDHYTKDNIDGFDTNKLLGAGKGKSKGDN